MIQTQGLTHIHLVVRDLDRALAFYTRVFGLEERFREGRCMVFLNTPASGDLITLNEDPAEARLAGGTLVERGEYAPGVPFVYVRDPDGYLIELLP